MIVSGDPVRWFHEEVHPHDSSLKAYLRGSFPAVGDVDDVVQESYLRIWRARAAQPIQSARAFLFRVARNVALDLVRHHRASPIDPVGDLAALEIADDGRGVAEAAVIAERIEFLIEALGRLQPRCREMVILCKLEGKSYREVAGRLGVSEKTVAEQVYRGTQRLGEVLQRRGLEKF